MCLDRRTSRHICEKADDAEAVVVVVVVNAVAVIVTVAVVVDAAAVALLFHVGLLCFHFSLKKTC